jgi:hypothetical protein
MSNDWFWANSKPLQWSQVLCFLLWFATLIGAVTLDPKSDLGAWCAAYWWIGFLLTLLAMIALRFIDFLLGRHD